MAPTAEKDHGDKTELPPYNNHRSSLVQQMEMEFQPEDVGPTRAAWGGQLEFILTCVGYAVGLGNVWRFPYLCYKNGGGAFLVPYIIMLSLVGLPLFFMELSFGQFASLGPIAIWRVNPLMKGLGYTMVISNTLIAIYYNVIIAWCMYYFFQSMKAVLPWSHCHNDWNTDACRDTYNSNITNITGAAFNMTQLNSTQLKTPSEEYFYNKALGISDGIEHLGSIQWPIFMCLLVAWVIVFFVLIKGISSLGKVVYFSSIFPYVLLTAMFVRGVTLPGAVEGIKFYLMPDFQRLTDATVWSDAAVQIFYSLGTCTGGLVAMASYNPFKNNSLRDSLLVPFINCGTSIYSGFVIFSVLGFMAHEKGVEVKDVAASGPGLVFVVYPEGLQQMPLAPLWAVLFFFMMMTLGFSSQFSMTECFFASFTDELATVLSKGHRRSYIFRAFFCIVFFCLAIPMTTQGGFYVFNMVDTFVGGFPLLLVGLLEIVAIMYIYGFNRFANDIAMMLGKKPNIYFKATWCFISPAILLAIIVFKSVQFSAPTLSVGGGYTYPDASISVAWLLVILPVSFIPGFFIYRYLRDGGWQLLQRLSSPTPAWGPANIADRTGIYRPEATPAKSDYLTTISGGIYGHVNDAMEKDDESITGTNAACASYEINP